MFEWETEAPPDDDEDEEAHALRQAHRLRALIAQALQLLAASLFAETARNRLVLLGWMSEIIVLTPESAPAVDAAFMPAAGSSGWQRKESARQERRRTSRLRVASRGAADDAALGATLAEDHARLLRTLAPVAITNLHRRVPRVAKRTLSAVDAMRDFRQAGLASVPRQGLLFSAPSSLVHALRALFRVLLVTPVALVLAAAGPSSLRLHLFGTRALGHLFVPSSVLSLEEARTLEYLAFVAALEDAPAAAEDDEDTLALDAATNSAFELALNREALVWALCDTILYGGGSHLRVRHVLEAALRSTAALPEVLAAGYYETLQQHAAAVRDAPLPPDWRRSPAAAAAAAHEYAARHNIMYTSFAAWRAEHATPSWLRGDRDVNAGESRNNHG